MPKCTYPAILGGCDSWARDKSDRCDNHQVRTNDLRKLEKQAVTKAEQAAIANKRLEEERVARDTRANAIKDRQAKREAEQAEVIRKHKQTWSAQIQGVYDQVEALRTKDSSANAGRNGVGETLGGNKNPIKLVLSGPTHGVTHAQILSQISGFDASDSGIYKFRRKSSKGNDILIHCE